MQRAMPPSFEGIHAAANAALRQSCEEGSWVVGDAAIIATSSFSVKPKKACEKGQKPQQALHLLQELQFRGLLPDVIRSKLLTGALGRFRFFEPIEGRTG